MIQICCVLISIHSCFRCLLLILELSRVEVAVLINYLGYLKYGASSSMIGEISQKQAKLSIAFYLLEKIIKLISEVGEDEGIVFGFHLYLFKEINQLVLEI
ncbi:hypothetical protein Dimus_030522 [Dionaea muscipula]